MKYIFNLSYARYSENPCIYSEELINKLKTQISCQNVISVSYTHLLSKGCDVIYYGAHSDDAAGNAYPDCSEVFKNAMNQAIYEGSGRQLRVEAPFVNLTKADVVKKGLELNVPYELTWSCYEGGEKPCGKCGTCIDRAKAFAANGVADPAL